MKGKVTTFFRKTFNSPDDSMNVFVVGSGGREHALTWALTRSASVKQIYSATGNAGILKISFDRDLKPFLLQLKENFTQYERM